MTRIITLLSDFGLQDVYVGVMKGAIARINPQLKVIDLTHNIPPQNIAAGRFCLMNAYEFFPEETVHVAVVDPGVGTQRRGIGVKFAAGGYLIGPDNGLFSGVLSLSQAVAAVELTNSDYWRSQLPSTTFHGRDIFAPVGAHLASGVPLEQLGNEIDPGSLMDLAIPKFKVTDTGMTGFIQYVDYFGNLISNIPAASVEGKSWSLVVRDFVIASGKTYSDGKMGEIVALVGSHGWVEIAVNGGNAAERLQLHWGEVLEFAIVISND